MNPGHFAAFAYIPKSSDRKDLRDTLTIYDAGNIQGFLIKEPTGKTKWIVFQVDYRLVQEGGVIVEGRTILAETEAPLHYFSIETYPMRSQSQGKFQQLWSLPDSQILVTLSEESLFPPRTLSEEPLFSFPQLLLQQPQLLPSPSQPKGHVGPELRESRKSDSLKLTDGRQSSRNNYTSGPKQKALSSSNRDSREPPLLRAPVTQEGLLQQLLQEDHNGHESSESHPWTSLAQQSLYSLPPPDLAEEHAAQASVSPPPISSQ